MSKIRPIKIVVADSSFMIRKGLKTIVSENKKFTWIGECTDYNGLETILRNTRAEVLIIEHALEGLFSIEEIESIKNKHALLNILVISNLIPAENIKKIINLGIKNYLLKDCDEKEITDAIISCYNGQKYFCGKIIDSLLERELSILNSCASGAISDREIEVIVFLVNGKRPKEIAELMKLSYHTIVTHKRNIFSKLGISNSIELAQYALKTGLIK